MKTRYTFGAVVLAALLVLAGNGSSAEMAGAEPPAYVPGSWDAEAVRLLKQSTSSLVLRKTSIRTLAPQYWVDTRSATNWADALMQVDRLYGTNNQKRALFLWKFIGEGMPASSLKALRLSEPTSGSYIIGSGRSVVYVLESGHEASLPKRAPEATIPKPAVLAGTNSNPKAARTLGTNTLIIDSIYFEPPPKASLVFSISSDAARNITGKVRGSASLVLNHFDVEGVHYNRIGFNADDALIDFQRDIEFPNRQTRLSIGGNTSGTGGSNYYSALIWRLDSRELPESISFSPDLVLKERWVRDTATHRTNYREVYKDGKLIRRVHYGEKRTEHGVQSIIVRTEEF